MPAAQGLDVGGKGSSCARNGHECVKPTDTLLDAGQGIGCTPLRASHAAIKAAGGRSELLLGIGLNLAVLVLPLFEFIGDLLEALLKHAGYAGLREAIAGIAIPNGKAANATTRTDRRVIGDAPPFCSASLENPARRNRPNLAIESRQLRLICVCTSRNDGPHAISSAPGRGRARHRWPDDDLIGCPDEARQRPRA